MGRASFQEVEVEVQIAVHSSGEGWLRMRVGEFGSGSLGVDSILDRKWTAVVQNNWSEKKLNFPWRLVCNFVSWL